MTLVQCVVAPWGIWHCSDNRLTNSETRKVLDDRSMKSVQVKCSDGAMLISYSGLGRIGAQDTSKWVASVFRNENRTVHESIQHIRLEATALFQQTQWTNPVYNHLFIVGAFIGGQAWHAEIRNVVPHVPWGAVRPLSEFVIAARHIDDVPLIASAGVVEAVSREDQTRVWNAASKKRPRHPAEIGYLLALTNRRAAEHPKGRAYISAAGRSSWILPGDGPIVSERFDWGKFHPSLATAWPTPEPFILFGIDVYGMFAQLNPGGLRYPPGLIDLVNEHKRKFERLTPEQRMMFVRANWRRNHTTARLRTKTRP